MKYFCCDERRREALRGHPALNGIDFLEVLDNAVLPFEQCQRTLFVHFINALTPGTLNEKNVLIEGGERIRSVQVTKVTINTLGSPPLSPPGNSKVLIVEVDKPGDFSTYTLRLVRSADNRNTPNDFDPILSAVDFSFKVACPSDFDCNRERIYPPKQLQQPDINYLAKDYASFKRVMLDRMAVLMPEWKERNPVDLGIALVELLSYVGDYLSYQQDAIATEAYLGTARRRVSVRRHVRLVDYPMHDGCNARVWVHLRLRPDIAQLQIKKGSGTKTTKFLTRVPEQKKAIISPESKDMTQALAAQPEVFELMHDTVLYSKHNELSFYTWGDRECCLPKGATRATLDGHFPNLQKGDVLILIEVRGPGTGEFADADPSRRCAVRLINVTLAHDLLGADYLASPSIGSPPLGIPVTEIEWHSDDALPFPFCISARRGTDFFEDVSIALGNIASADHGLTIEDEPLGEVKAANPALTKVHRLQGERCREQSVTMTPPRFNPKLAQAPLTNAASSCNEKRPPASAYATIHQTVRDTLPVITLREPGESEPWKPKRDLLNSHDDEKHFVVEVETDGTAVLRFGDDVFGSRPAAGTRLHATYRIGNGACGNVGAGTLAHIVSSDPSLITELTDPIITEVRNPLPAYGGTEPETIEQARQNAPSAFHTQERAVTPDDYAAVAQRCSSEVQRAAATFRWTGSWRTVFLTVDRFGGKEVDRLFEKDLRSCLERYRMAGHDIEVDGPLYVSLEIEMIVCLKPGYFAGDVKAGLLDVFSNRVLPDGRRGVFHPDNFSFGQAVYLGPLYAAAQATDGVASVDIITFQRQGIPDTEALSNGKLEISRLEIARLDNDPNFPERGVFNLIMKGGA